MMMVEIKFLLWSIEMSRALWMFLLLTIGGVIGWFLKSYFNHVRKARR
jgi:LPS O-antigen subunit length determinant protein (WzzB/FepE family)